MAFNAYGASQNEGKKRSSVDFNKVNEYVVETAGLQERETLIGVVSMIVDLGTQKQPDAEVPFTGSEEDERMEVASKPATYFKDGVDPQTKKPVRLKCWPQKDVQAVALAVDFPQIVVDKGQFFGDSNPLPLRLWLGDQFYNQATQKMVVARPTYLKINKKLGFWSFDQKHLLYKMVVAAKLIKPGEAFLPQDIDKLLGQAFQFEAQVFFKKGKDGKSYYNEYVKFVSGLGRGQSAPETSVKPLLIGFMDNNDEKAIKEVRAHVLNTCRLASNWEGSKLEKQVETIRYKNEDGDDHKDAKPQQQQSNVTSNDFDDPDLPF